MTYLDDMLMKLDPFILASERVNSFLGRPLRGFHCTNYNIKNPELDFDPEVETTEVSITGDSLKPDFEISEEFAPRGYKEFFEKQIELCGDGKVTRETLYSIESARIYRQYNCSAKLEDEMDRILERQKTAAPGEVWMGKKRMKSPISEEELIRIFNE